MKILSASQIRELDAFTIQQENIDSADLMERASMAFVDWFVENFDKNKKIKIFCGPGNNGGDGLAIARILIGKSYKQVKAYTFQSENYSRDFKINKQRLESITELHLITESTTIPAIASDEIIIDAIFGSGLSKLIEGIYAETIEAINKSGSLVVSVDIASGLFCDQVNNNKVIVEPDYTISFQLPKLSFLLPRNEKYIGHWKLVDIGLSQEYIDKSESAFYFTDIDDIYKILKPRRKFAHKGDFGKALMIAGSYGMMGAAVLASKACLRTGVGLCVSYVPKCGYDIMQTSVPENMVITDKESETISSIPDLQSYDAIAVGPGLGKSPKAMNALQALLEKTKVPLVIDADALNLLSENKELLKKIPAGSILTPHPKEFERLAGKSADDYIKLEMLRSFAAYIKSCVVLKGAHTAVCTPEGKIYFNSTGNPGMATGGSGDVLTGIITSLLAQGYSAKHAAILGVYLHGYAGYVAAMAFSEQAMTASDILDGIGEFFKQVN